MAPEIHVAALEHAARRLSANLADPQAIEDRLLVYGYDRVNDELMHRMLADVYSQFLFSVEWDARHKQTGRAMK
jgi:hypothetical protein